MVSCGEEMKINKERELKNIINTNTEILEKQINFFQNVYVISKQRNEKITLKRI